MGVKGKYFMIVSEDSGLVLDVKGAGKSPGTDVILWEKSGNDNQVWYEHPVTGTIRSKHNDLCLEFNSSNFLVINSHQAGNRGQQFHYNKQRKTFDSEANAQKVFDVYEGSKKPGAQVCLWDYHGRDNQKWKIEPVGHSRYFFIKSAMNGKVLDIEGASKQSGAKVIMWDQKDKASADNQLWFEDRYGNIRSKNNDKLVLDATGDCLHVREFQLGNRKEFWCVCGNKIVNRYDEKEVLDIKDECKDDGAELCGWQYKGSANQHWHFEYV